MFTNADEYELHKAWPDLRPKSKFALYSAHDVTIMTLLASLGGTLYSSVDAWPPYASMLNIELYDIQWTQDAPDEIVNNFPTGVGFRMVYNGNVITDHITGCMQKEEICDIDLLVLHVYPFANVTEWNDTCQRQNVQNGGRGGSGGILDSSQRYSDLGQNIVLFLIGGLLCGVCGAFVTFLYLSKKQAQFDVVPQHPDGSLELTRSHEYANGNGNGNGDAKIYGLPIEQEGRDII